jgi:gamma-butyrobetaine dioxygenase
VDPRTEDAKRLWHAADTAGRMPRGRWPDCLAGRDCRRVCQSAAFYAACRAFAGLLCDPTAMLTVRLAPGDCAVFDNTRILHGRTGFASSGSRHVQGCYADLDGIESAVAVAGRADQPERTRKDWK